MDKTSHAPERDIANEPYAGPSASVTAIGHGAIEHLYYAVVGLVGAGALAYVFHKPATQIVEGARALGTRLKAWTPEGDRLIDRSRDTLSDWGGWLLHMLFGDPAAAASVRQLSGRASAQHAEWLDEVARGTERGFGHLFFSHTIGRLPYVGKCIRGRLGNASPRMETAIAFGGGAGFFGYIGGWVKALVQGAQHGNPGKEQFECAQATIRQLQAQGAHEPPAGDAVNAPNPKPAEKSAAPLSVQHAVHEGMVGAAVERMAQPG